MGVCAAVEKSTKPSLLSRTVGSNVSRNSVGGTSIEDFIEKFWTHIWMRWMKTAA